MSNTAKHVSPEEFEALVEKYKKGKKPKSFARMLAESSNACPSMCVRHIPPRIGTMITGVVEVRFSRTHCKAIYEDGSEETYEILPPELESLNENTTIYEMVSLIQSKRGKTEGGPA